MVSVGMNDLTKKKKYYELLRIVSILSVMFSHTPGFNAVGMEHGILYAAQMLFAIMTRVSVPLFFMISGALLLGKEESISKTLRRSLRFAICLVLFSLLAYLQSIDYDLSRFWLRYYVVTLYSGMHSETYWFLYSYLSFILMLPFIRRLAQGMTNKEFRYMMAFVLTIGIIRDIQYLLSNGEVTYSSGFVFFILETTVLYPLVGYYVEHKTEQEYFNKRNTIVLIASSVLVYIITCLCTRFCIRNIINGVETNWSELIDNLRIVVAFTVMYFAKYLIKGDCSDKFGKVIALIASCVFGAYLLEPVIKYWTMPIYDYLEPQLGVFFASKTWVLVTLITGCAITWVLKRIPGLRKIL